MPSRKNQTLLLKIFAEPTAADIGFAEVKRLVLSLGGEMKQGKGSRVRFSLDGIVYTLHKPHPKPELKKYQVEDVRDFLERAGYAPNQGE